MKGLGLEVEILEKPLYVSSPLGTRVSVDMICRGCELEISEILITVVEILEKPLYVSSPIGTRVSVDLICRGCELEISEILLTVDLRVIDMSEFDVILGMDWLTAHHVVIDYDHSRVIAYTQE